MEERRRITTIEAWLLGFGCLMAVAFGSIVVVIIAATIATIYGP